MSHHLPTKRRHLNTIRSPIYSSTSISTPTLPPSLLPSRTPHLPPPTLTYVLPYSQTILACKVWSNSRQPFWVPVTFKKCTILSTKKKKRKRLFHFILYEIKNAIWVLQTRFCFLRSSSSGCRNFVSIFQFFCWVLDRSNRLPPLPASLICHLYPPSSFSSFSLSLSLSLSLSHSLSLPTFLTLFFPLSSTPPSFLSPSLRH